MDHLEIAQSSPQWRTAARELGAVVVYPPVAKRAPLNASCEPQIMEDCCCAWCHATCLISLNSLCSSALRWSNYHYTHCTYKDSQGEWKLSRFSRWQLASDGSCLQTQLCLTSVLILPPTWITPEQSFRYMWVLHTYRCRDMILM